MRSSLIEKLGIPGDINPNWVGVVPMCKEGECRYYEDGDFVFEGIRCELEKEPLDGPVCRPAVRAFYRRYKHKMIQGEDEWVTNSK